MNDSELIAKLGGPAKLAERLGYEKDGGVQRVQNWITRGIPAQVKVDFHEIFLPRIHDQDDSLHVSRQHVGLTDPLQQSPDAEVV